MRRSHVLCLAALLASSAAVPALAQDDQVRSQVVHYGDLNLDSTHGARRMVRRIERASSNVCNDNNSRRTLAESADARDCRVVAQENAVSDLDQPMVTGAYYGNRGGGSVVVTEDNGAVYDDSAAPVIQTDPNAGYSKGY